MEKAKVTLDIDLKNYDREKMIDIVNDSLDDKGNAEEWSDSELLGQYIHIALGSEMEYDDVGCVISDISIE